MFVVSPVHRIYCVRIVATNILLPNLSIVYPPDKAPNTAPPAKVDTIAPKIGESPVVSK